MPLRYFRLLACALVIAAEVAGRYLYRQPNLGYAVHFGGAVGGAAAALVLVRNVRLRSVRRSASPSTCAPTPSTRRVATDSRAGCHEFAFLLAGLVVYAGSALAVYSYAKDARPAIGMSLISPPLLAQLGMTSCSYDGDDSVLEPGARVFDLSAWRALCRGRLHAVDDDEEEVV